MHPDATLSTRFLASVPNKVDMVSLDMLTPLGSHPTLYLWTGMDEVEGADSEMHSVDPR